MQQVLDHCEGPVVAVSDHVKLVADQIGRFVPQPFIPLGTDGFGLSDTRAALRQHFEVDTGHIVVAVLFGLFAKGEIKPATITEATRSYGIEPETRDPRET